MRLIAIGCIASALVGCSSSPPAPAPMKTDPLATWPTRGERGEAGFAYLDGIAGVGLDVPLASGGAEIQAIVRLRPDAPPFTSIVSTDPGILRPIITERDARYAELIVTTGAAGQTALILLDEQGNEIDRAGVTVVDADVELTLAPGSVIVAGTQTSIAARLSTGGQRVLGTGSVQFHVDGWLQDEGATGNVETLIVNGQGNIYADSGASHAQVAVTSVIDAGALTALEPSSSSLERCAPPLAPGQYVPSLDIGAALAGVPDFTVTAHTDGQSAFAPPCSWTFDAPGLSIAGGDDATLDGSPAEGYFFSGPAGDYQATCHIGPLTTTIAVHICQ